MSTSPASLAELRKWLNLPLDGGDTDELQQVLDSATEAVEGEVGAVVARWATERAAPRRGPCGTPYVLLSQWPILEVASITPDDPHVSVAVLPAFPDDLAGGHVRLNSLSGLVTVVYRVGYDPVPKALKTAVEIVAAHLWETQRGPSVVVPAFGGEAVAGAPFGMGFALPKRALELIAQFKRKPSAARS